MTLTTNAHGMTEAEARELGIIDTDALVFSCRDSGKGQVTLFVPPSVAKATADAFNKAMQEHLTASGSQASGGGGFSSHALPPRNHSEEIAQAVEECREEQRRDQITRAQFDQECG